MQHGRGTIIQTDKVFESPWKVEIPDFDSSVIYGDAIIRLTASDLAGNESTAEAAVFFDNKGTKASAQLTTPKDGDVITGVVQIKGTAKTSGTFESYIIEYSIDSEPDNWQPIGQIGMNAVEVGLLAT